MTSRDERDALEHFRERYATPATDVTAQIEASVIGAVWGANGYTTLAQADELAGRLALGPGRRVLDIGTGRGWPGLCFASRYGCDVIGTDMPFDALAAAFRRAVSERLDGRFSAVAAAGAYQPFRSISFDASSTPTCCVDYAASSPCCEHSSDFYAGVGASRSPPSTSHPVSHPPLGGVPAK